jgi:Domain of unknown function (DUF4288)
VNYADSVALLRAPDWDAAFGRSLEVGQGLETSYENHQGKRVSHRFKEVLTLDQLGSAPSDGAEVCCRVEDVPLHERVDFDARFTPQESRPGQKGV